MGAVMRYPKMLQCMSLFSQESLHRHLGEELIDQLLSEWENPAPLTKRRLAEMILQLNGVEILKKAAFRKDLLLHMAPAEVEDLFQLLPNAAGSHTCSVEQKALQVAKQPWKPTPSNLQLLDLLGVDRSVIQADTVDSPVVVTHQAHARFYELLDYQFVIKQRLLYELEKDVPLKRMLVHMPTGTGKTKTTMHTLVHYYTFSLKKQGAILWLAHTTELLEQAYNTFSSVWSHLGDGQVTVYKLWGSQDVTQPEKGFQGILLCGIQKMLSIKQRDPALFQAIVRDTRLIIFDEAHKAAARETRQLVESFMILPSGYPDRSLVGLTATPGRTTLTSSENSLLSNMFENKLIGIDLSVVNQVNMSQESFLNLPHEDTIIHFFQRNNILSKIVKEQLTYPEEFTPEELQKIKTQVVQNGYVDFSKSSLELIGKKRSRNKAILQRLRELSVEGVPTIVFACSVPHAKLLSFMLSLDDVPNAVVLGEMNGEDRAQAIASFKDPEDPIKILINYEVLTTGFDSTNIRCVFITRPTQSIVLYSQMLGRGLRGPKMGGNPQCLLVDIKDNLGKYDPEMAFSHFDHYWN
jgi:DNA repair protein RadD